MRPSPHARVSPRDVRDSTLSRVQRLEQRIEQPVAENILRVKLPARRVELVHLRETSRGRSRGQVRDGAPPTNSPTGKRSRSRRRTGPRARRRPLAARLWPNAGAHRTWATAGGGRPRCSPRRPSRHVVRSQNAGAVVGVARKMGSCFYSNRSVPGRLGKWRCGAKTLFCAPRRKAPRYTSDLSREPYTGTSYRLRVLITPGPPSGVPPGPPAQARREAVAT